MTGQLLTVASIKWVFFTAVCLFEVGSAICGGESAKHIQATFWKSQPSDIPIPSHQAAPSMDVLIYGRALSGIGAAGISISYMVLIARISRIEHRAFMLSLMAGVLLVSTVIGPLLGGVLTDRASWRRVFYIK